MITVRIELSNPDRAEDRVQLNWEVLDTPAGFYWSKFAYQLLKSGSRIFPRFTGFVSPQKDMARLARDLDGHISTINSSGHYLIHDHAGSDFRFEQEFSNRIHHHFEVLCGSIDRPSAIFAACSGTPGNPLTSAILGLNHCIHDMEALDKALRSSRDDDTHFSAIILESFPGAPSVRISDEIFECFSLNSDFGDLVLHYCQIGKTWWEVFLDRDEQIFDEAIQPLRRINGEFDIFFGVHHATPQTLQEFHHFLRSRGQDPGDKRLALGFCPVGRMIREPHISNREYRELIAAHMKLDEIALHLGNGKKVSYRPVGQNLAAIIGCKS